MMTRRYVLQHPAKLHASRHTWLREVRSADREKYDSVGYVGATTQTRPRHDRERGSRSADRVYNLDILVRYRVQTRVQRNNIKPV